MKSGLAIGGASDVDQPVLIRDARIRSKEYPFHPSAHDSVRTDAEREAKNRDDRKSGGPAKHSKAESAILHETLEPETAGHLARDLLHMTDVSELSMRVRRSILRRLAACDALVDGHAQMRVELLPDLRIAAGSVQSKDSREPHASLAAGGAITPAMASASCFHFDRSADS